MNGRLLSELKAQRSVNELVNYFGMLTREVNKIYAAKISADKKAQAIVGGDDAGADELTEILDEMLKPELVKLTPEKLQDYIVRAYMTQIYFQVKADQLQKQMDGKNSNRKFFDECESIKKCLGCAAAVLALLVDNKISKNKKYNYKNIMSALEKEYEDFELLLQMSTLENKKKICVLPPESVADMSRCITLTELIPFNKLHASLKNFYPNQVERNRFQRTLCYYMTKNITKITNAQNDIASNAGEIANKNDEKTKNTTMAMILATIRDLILTTKWTCGWLGGVDIYDDKGKLMNTVPNGMAEVVTLINQGFPEKMPLIQKLKAVEFLVDRSANYKASSFLGFGKRHEKTQQSYEKIGEYINTSIRNLNFHR